MTPDAASGAPIHRSPEPLAAARAAPVPVEGLGRQGRQHVRQGRGLQHLTRDGLALERQLLQSIDLLLDGAFLLQIAGDLLT